MSQKQKAKSKKRAEHQQRNELRRLEFFNEALRRAGLLDGFRRLIPKTQSYCRAAALPLPEIVLDASAEGCERAREIQKQLPAYLREPIADCGQEASVVDMFCILIPLKVHVDAILRLLRGRHVKLAAGARLGVEEFAAKLDAFVERQQKTLINDFATMLWLVTIHNSLIDRRLYAALFTDRRTPAGRIIPRIVIHKKIPTREKITVDGLPRPAIRCCVPAGPAGFLDITWKGTDIGYLDDPREYPVFMQSHVLEQLERRVPHSHHI